MPYWKPDGILAGFHAQDPEPEVPELVHIGEQWAPRHLRIPEHRHDVWELYVQIDGQSCWASEHGAYQLEPGGFLAVPPDRKHWMEGVPDSRHHFYFAAVDIEPVLGRMPELAPVWRTERPIHAARAERILAPFAQLIREVSFERPHRALGIRCAIDAIVIEASRIAGECSRVWGEAPAEDARRSLILGHPAVVSAKQMIDFHPGERWQLRDLAKRTGLSAGHLAECFTREIGVPPHRYLNQVRIARARRMLAESDADIVDIALELGFSSTQHFSAAFRAATGHTPRGFRRAMTRASSLPREAIPQ